MSSIMSTMGCSPAPRATSIIIQIAAFPLPAGEAAPPPSPSNEYEKYHQPLNNPLLPAGGKSFLFPFARGERGGKLLLHPTLRRAALLQHAQWHGGTHSLSIVLIIVVKLLL